MKPRITFHILITNLFVIFSSTVFSQHIEWGYQVDTVSSEYSKFRHSGREILGVPNVAPHGRSSIYAWAVQPNAINMEGVETAFIEINLQKAVNAAQQVAVFESKNPGAVTEIFVKSKAEVNGKLWHRVYLDTAVISRTGYRLFQRPQDNYVGVKHTLGTIRRKWWNIFKKDENFQPKVKHRILRAYFPKKDIIAVRIILNLFAVDGWNEIDAVAVSDSQEPVGFPQKYLAGNELIKCSKRVNLGPTVNSPASEIAPVPSPDDYTLYFSRTDYPKQLHTQNIWTTHYDTVNYTMKCSRNNTSLIKKGAWFEAQPFQKQYNSFIPNAIAGFSSNGKYMYLNNVYKESKCKQCDSIFLKNSHGLSVSSLDSVAWETAGNAHTRYLDADVRRKFKNYAISPDENILLASSTDETLSVKNIFYAYKTGKKSWSDFFPAGNATKGIQVVSPEPPYKKRKLVFKFTTMENDTLWNCLETKWSEPEEITIEGFENSSNYFNFHVTPVDTVMLLSIKHPNGNGDRDIYVSFKKAEKLWSEPVNIGTTINTLSDDCTPFLDDDTYTMFFSSAGHNGYGDRDIYVTKRLDNTWLNWSKPKNLGPHVNTAGSDAFFNICYKTRNAYFASTENAMSCNRSDIFRVKTARLLNIQLAGYVRDVNTKMPIEAAVSFNRLDEFNEPDFRRMNFYSDAMYGRYKADLFEMIDGRNLGRFAISASSKNHVMTDSLGNPIDFEILDLQNTERLVSIQKNLWMKGGKRQKRKPDVTLAEIYKKEHNAEIPQINPKPIEPVYTYKQDTVFIRDTVWVSDSTVIEPRIIYLYRDANSTLCGEIFQEGKLYKMPSKDNPGPFVLIEPVYQKYFDYNKTDIAMEDRQFQYIYKEIQHQWKNKKPKDKVYVCISSSASKVPAPSNEWLAFQRGMESKKMIEAYLNQQNIPRNDVVFRYYHVVGGPQYNNDADTNKQKYMAHQYVKIWVYVCQSAISGGSN